MSKGFEIAKRVGEAPRIGQQAPQLQFSALGLVTRTVTRAFDQEQSPEPESRNSSRGCYLPRVDDRDRTGDLQDHNLAL